MEILLASLPLLIFWIRLILKPYLLNNILFLINIPMSIFVGIGMLMFSFSSSDDYIQYDRELYSEGALAAAKWILNKKPGLYSMRNLLNFK